MVNMAQIAQKIFRATFGTYGLQAVFVALIWQTGAHHSIAMRYRGQMWVVVPNVGQKTILICGNGIDAFLSKITFWQESK